MRLTIIFFALCFCFGCGSDDGPSDMTIERKLSMDPISILEGEQDRTVYVSLKLDGVSSNDVTVVLETEAITATDGEDFIAFDDYEVVLESGDVQSNVPVVIKGDDVGESDETFRLKIKEITGASNEVDQVSITIENDDQDLEVNIPTGGADSPTEYAGMTMTWSDEFNGTELNESDWTFEYGNGEWGWGNNELEYYRKENTFMLDGNMVIQARDENFAGLNYTSSRIITKNKVEFTFGRVDIRAILPEGQGVWPALWMLGGNLSEVGWPRCGEIDIMELVGHEPSTVHGTVHYSNQNGDRIMQGSSKTLTGGKKFSDEFHVFSIVWKQNSIEWLVDNQKYFSVTNSTLGAQNPYPFNDEFFFIFNVAVGGTWPGAPNNFTQFPQNMIVDYIRVFQEN